MIAKGGAFVLEYALLIADVAGVGRVSALNGEAITILIYVAMDERGERR